MKNEIRYFTHLKYIYENTIELDFYSESKLLIECKFHNEELSKKQQALFDKVEAKQKFIVRNYKDVDAIVHVQKY